MCRRGQVDGGEVGRSGVGRLASIFLKQHTPLGCDAPRSLDGSYLLKLNL